MYQKHVIVGNLGSDAEMRYTGSGQAVANFSVAVNRKWTGQDGEQKEETTWYRVAIWGKFAEALTPFLTKGKAVLVEGTKLAARAYTDKAGEARASLELTAETVRLLGGGNGHQAQDDEQDDKPVAPDMDEIAF